jgi:hypothetical protein
MSTTTTQSQSLLASLFNFNNPEAEENSEYMEEIGTLVFQSALMMFLAEATPAEAEAFESFIEENISSESFIEELCQKFPEFEKLLSSEMNAFYEAAL